jgi:uncharacterized protein YeaO (DUF488 family)
MEENINALREKVDDLFESEKYDEIINLLTNKVLEKQNDAELYVRKGLAWYYKKDYDKAITNNKKALEINPSFELALYNRGAAWVAKKDFDKAIEDYNKAIDFKSDYKDIYLTARGNVWKANKEYSKAIDDYTEAIKINPVLANAYYSRGLAKIEENIDLTGSKLDFETYLKLATDENDLWAKYAKYYLKKIDEKNDRRLTDIVDIVSKIKSLLHIKDDCITHYTSLTVFKSLIFDESKFRISEGNCMNDPSEGVEFFNFLKYTPLQTCKNGTFFESFSPKPFIGSFVPKGKHNDLNMWRFYGKEKGVEAKGCAITLHTQEFIDGINKLLSDENREARIDNETDINFYKVAYLTDERTNFYIPSSDEKSQELLDFMTKLRRKVKIYKGDNSTSLEEYLNSISFLFKSDSYKNENEVRLIVKGIEFKKKYNMDVTPPRVYIELESIKKRVKQITLGPKVDNVNEWASAFHYSYEDDVPEILISHLPYK